MTVRQGGRVVGLAAFGAATVRRRGLIVSRGLYLNETGRKQHDALAVEINGILCEPDQADAVTVAALDTLVRREEWDELHLSGIASNSAERDWAAPAARLGLTLREAARRPCPYVDLAALRGGGGDYLERLSRNTRSQIRRAMRRYEQTQGSIALTVARDAAEARAWLDELAALHQTTWTRRGQPGAFANPFFAAVHDRLVERATPAGAVELVRVTAGAAPIGILYNFLWRGHVCNYQSGFDYAADAALKPGLVSHAVAIRQYATRGFDVYDFLAGADRYKASLCTGVRDLVWLVARRKRLKYMIEDSLRTARNRFRTARPAAPSTKGNDPMHRTGPAVRGRA